MRRIKGKAIILCSVLAFALAFSGCNAQTPSATTEEPAATETADEAAASSETASSDGKIKIGVSSQTFSIEVYTMMRDGATEWFKTNAPDVEFTWLSCDYEPSKQIAQVEDFISQGYSCVAIEPVLPETGDQLFKMCRDANIPIVDLETMAAEEIADIFIVADSYKVGVTQGEYFAEKFGTTEPANIVILSATKGDYVAGEITQGLVDTLAKYDNVNIVMHQWCKDWDPSVALANMENALSANNNDIDVVFANNDQMANAALRAAINANVADKILFVGSDFDRETVENIREGYNIAVLDKSPTLQGEHVAEAALKLAKGEEIEYDVELDNGLKAWWTPIEMVDASNLEKKVAEKFPDMAKQ